MRSITILHTLSLFLLLPSTISQAIPPTEPQPNVLPLTTDCPTTCGPLRETLTSCYPYRHQCRVTRCKPLSTPWWQDPFFWRHPYHCVPISKPPPNDNYTDPVTFLWLHLPEDLPELPLLPIPSGEFPIPSHFAKYTPIPDRFSTTLPPAVPITTADFSVEPLPHTTMENMNTDILLPIFSQPPAPESSIQPSMQASMETMPVEAITPTVPPPREDRGGISFPPQATTTPKVVQETPTQQLDMSEMPPIPPQVTTILLDRVTFTPDFKFEIPQVSAKPDEFPSVPQPSLSFTPFPLQQLDPSFTPEQTGKVPLMKPPAVEDTPYPSLDNDTSAMPGKGKDDEKKTMPTASMEYTPYPSMDQGSVVTPDRGDRGITDVLPQPSMDQEPTTTPSRKESDKPDRPMKPSMEVIPFPSADLEPSMKPSQGQPVQTPTPVPVMTDAPSQAATIVPTPAQPAQTEEQPELIAQPSTEYTPYPSMDRPAKTPYATAETSTQADPSESVYESPEFTGIPLGYTYEDMFPREPSLAPSAEQVGMNETVLSVKSTVQPSEEAIFSLMPTITPSVMMSASEQPTPMVTPNEWTEETPTPSTMVIPTTSTEPVVLLPGMPTGLDDLNTVMPSIEETTSPSTMPISATSTDSVIISPGMANGLDNLNTISPSIEDTLSPSTTINPTTSTEPFILIPGMPKGPGKNDDPSPSASSPPQWIDINLFSDQQPVPKTSPPKPQPWIDVNLEIPFNGSAVRAAQTDHDTPSQICRTITAKTNALSVKTTLRSVDAHINVLALGHTRGVNCVERENIPFPQWVAYNSGAGWESVNVRIGAAHRASTPLWGRKVSIDVQMGARKVPSSGKMDIVVLDGEKNEALFDGWIVNVKSMLRECGENKEVAVVKVFEIGPDRAIVQACMK